VPHCLEGRSCGFILWKEAIRSTQNGQSVPQIVIEKLGHVEMEPNDVTVLTDLYLALYLSCSVSGLATVLVKPEHLSQYVTLKFNLI